MVAVDAGIRRAEQALEQGDLDAAIQEAERVLRKKPKIARAHHVLGIAHARRQNWSEAIAALERAAARAPLFQTLLNLGVAHMQRGEPAAARTWFEACVARYPKEGLGHYNLAVVRAALGDPEGATAAYRRELELRGDQALGFTNLGLLLKARGRLDEARAIWSRGRRARPKDTTLALNLAQLELEAKRPDLAIDGIEAFLAEHPDRDDIRANLAVAYAGVGRLDEAQAMLEALYERHPNDANLLHNLGNIRLRNSAFEKAEGVLRRAVEIGHNPDSHRGLHVSLREQCRTEEASAALEDGVRRFPDHPGLVVEALTWLPRYYRDMDEVRSRRARYAEALRDLEALATGDRIPPSAILEQLDERNSFGLPYQGEIDVELQRRYGEIHADLVRRARPLPPPRPRRGRRPRVGWASSHFHEHTVAKLMTGFLAERTPDRFEYVAIQMGTKVDDTTRRLFAAADEAHHLHGTADWLARRLHALELDVLVLTDVGMCNVSQGLAARRMAPVQATTICHPETTGYPDMDVFVSIADWEPEDGPAHYTEELVTLPGTGVFFERRAPAPPLTRADFHLPDEGFIFLSAQTLFKYLPLYDEVYARILEGAPDAHLVFLRGRNGQLSAHFTDRIRNACRALGFDSEERLHVLPSLSEAAFGRLHAVADVSLDSLPFSSFTSVLEAWSQAPIPLVAREGRVVRERCAAACLRQVGMDELVAADADAFVEIALRLYRDPAFRERARRTIEAGAPVLFSDRRPVLALEDHLEAWAAGQRR